jgi:hypothetical protein
MAGKVPAVELRKGDAVIRRMHPAVVDALAQRMAATGKPPCL